MDQDETWHAGRTRPWPHCVRWGPSSPPPKWDGAPKFSARICCSQMAGWIKMLLGREAGLSPSDIVRWGPSSPSPKGGRCPKFSVHVYCGQTAGWIKMPLGTEVGLSPGHTVLTGTQLPPRKGHSTSPYFRPMSVVATVAHLSYCSARLSPGPRPLSIVHTKWHLGGAGSPFNTTWPGPRPIPPFQVSS